MSARTAMYRAVLFDLDGTLIEFRFKIKESRRAMIQLLQGRGYVVTQLNEKMRTQVIIDRAMDQWNQSEKLKQSHSFEEVRSEIFRLLDRFEYDAFAHSKLHPGSLQVLRKIRDAQILTGVVTNSGSAPAQSILVESGLLPYLSTVVARDDVPRLKPSSDGLLEAIKRLGVIEKETLYVGDSTLDIEASRLANIKCASISSGLFKAETLRQLHPDFMLERIEELEKIVLP